jgi:hypothetical protein
VIAAGPRFAALEAVISGERNAADAEEALFAARTAHGRALEVDDPTSAAAAVRLYAAAFRADPTLLEGGDERCSAARDAVLAAAQLTEGGDAAQFRGQALDWLRAELARRERELTTDAPSTRAELAWWLETAELATVRDAIDELPDAEAADWVAFWSRVRELAKRP